MPSNTLRKAAKVVLVILTSFAVLRWGDQFGWLDADAWIDLSAEGDLQGVLVFGLLTLLFVFSDEFKLTNNVDANGHAIEHDEQARRVGNRSPLAIIAAFVVGTILFKIIVFFNGT